MGRRTLLALEMLEDRLSPASLTVNSTADTASSSDSYLSLREAIAIVNSPTLPSGLSAQILAQITGTLHAGRADTIAFDPAHVTGPIVLGGSSLSLTIAAGTSVVTIDGGSTGVTVDANHHSAVLGVQSGVQASLQHLTLTRGAPGIATSGSTLTLSNCTLSSNSGGYGGGIYAVECNLTLNNCTLTGNSANYGAGIEVEGDFLSGSSTVTVSNSTLTGNSAGYGAGINFSSDGSLTVSNSTLTGNSGGYGAGIEFGSSGRLTVTNSLLTSNSANYGAGILFSGGSLSTGATVSDCTLAGNTGGSGGGILAENGILTVSNCTLTGNSANVGGGLGEEAASVTVTNCFLTANTATYGGGIWANPLQDSGSISVTYSQLSGNLAQAQGSTGGEGGAVYATNPNLVVAVAGCTLSGNSATNNGGAIRTVDRATVTIDGCLLESNSAARGGALDNSPDRSSPAASVTVVHTLFEVNTANDGGAIANNGPLSVAACSLVADTAYRGGGLFQDGGFVTVLSTTVSSNSGYQSGGGLDIEGGSAVLVSLTVAENAAASGGGLFVAAGANPVLLRNSIVWGNTDLGGAANNIGGQALDPSSSYNLIGTGGSGGLTNGVNHNLVGVVDAGLLPLANNGGPTLSYALAASSPARGAGDPTLVGDPLFGWDQRDVPRTAPVAIGAFQP
jgi:predicted outer membrane repeat protein